MPSVQHSHSHQTRPPPRRDKLQHKEVGGHQISHPLRKPNCATGPVAGQKTAESGHLMSLPQASIPNFHLEPPPGLPLQAPDADRQPPPPPQEAKTWDEFEAASSQIPSISPDQCTDAHMTAATMPPWQALAPSERLSWCMDGAASPCTRDWGFHWYSSASLHANLLSNTLICGRKSGEADARSSRVPVNPGPVDS